MLEFKVTASSHSSDSSHHIWVVSPSDLTHVLSEVQTTLGYESLDLKFFEFEGKDQQIVVIPHTQGNKQAVLVGWEQKVEPMLMLRHTTAQLGQMLKSKGGEYFVHIPSNVDVLEFTRQFVYGIGLGLYNPKTLVSESKPLPPFSLVLGSEQISAETIKDVTDLVSVSHWMRYLQDLPPNHLFPQALAEETQKRFAPYSEVKVEILDEHKMAEMGFGAFLAVGRGAEKQPRAIILSYRHPQAQKHIGLVGKALTFDSGGKNLKDRSNILDMKYDMSGGALVLACAEYIARLKLPINLTVFVGAAENSIDGRSYNPNDILRTYSGKTVEVLDTDAEGRLVISDLLSYAEKEYKPECILEFSTLTGAIMVALGSSAAGVFANQLASGEWLEKIKTASVKSAERIWHMPVFADHHEFMKGVFSDLQNVGVPMTGGSSTAAAFLFEFLKETPMLHFDIAGMASGVKGRGYGKTQANGRSSSGFGLLFLSQFFKDLSM